MIEAFIKIQCKDGIEFKVTKRILPHCKSLSSIPGIEEDDIKLELPGELFQKIIEFFQHFNYDVSKVRPIKKPLQTSNFALITDDWCANFFKTLTEDELGEIVMAASYLQSQVLFDYGCSYVACCFKDLTLEETKQKFEIMEDLTPELEEQLKKEYAPTIFKDPSSQTDLFWNWLSSVEATHKTSVDRNSSSK